MDRVGAGGLYGGMRTGWIGRLRRKRRGIVLGMMAMLILPLLLGLLSLSAPSAATALDRDIALSLCGPSDQPGEPGSGRHDLRHECCILCSAGCPACAPSATAGAAAFGPTPRAGHSRPIAADADVRPARPVLSFGSPPRAPPAILPI